MVKGDGRTGRVRTPVAARRETRNVPKLCILETVKRVDRERTKLKKLMSRDVAGG